MAAALWLIGLTLIGIAGLLHIGFFLLQTVLWPSRGRRLFGVSREHDDAVRPWARNQGWYNLFLAVGAIGSAVAGIVWWDSLLAIIAAPIAAFVALCMLGASLVLLATDRRMRGGALLQGLAPLLGLIALGFATFG